MWRDYKTAQEKKRQSFVAFVPMSNSGSDVSHLLPPPPNPDTVSVPMEEAGIRMQESTPNPGTGDEAAPGPVSIFTETVNYSEDYMVGVDNKNNNHGFHGGVDAVDSPNFYPPYYRNNKPMRYFEARPYPPPPPRGSVKRSLVFEGSGIENKKPRIVQSASAIVNEKVPGLEYKFSDMKGPPHDPSFECTVFFPPNDKAYTGTGRSKKLAKCSVAENILADMGIPIPEREVKEKKPLNPERKIKAEPQVIITPPSQENAGQPNFSAIPVPVLPVLQMMNLPPALDFSSDDLPGITPGVPLYPPEPVSYIDAKKLKRLGKININESPCCALNSLLGPGGATSGPDIKYEFISGEGPPHEKVFQVKLTFKEPEIPANQTPMIEKEFIGTGGSKKKAKGDAAKQALIYLIGAQHFAYLQQLGMTIPWATQAKPTLGVSPSPKARKTPKKAKDPETLQYIVFADHVSQLVNDKFASLTAQNEVHATQKVLAGVVMTRGDPLQQNSTIVAVTTGTKCIEGDYMSDQGLALNDCHAEILATRCVRDFLYSQIDLLNSMDNPMAETKPDPETLIFENFGESSEGVTRYRLKEDVQFHLYISTSPCGDARIFSPNGIDVADPDEPKQAPGEEAAEPVDVDAHPKRINRGLLRAKIEAGEGTIPVANLNTGSGIQTWDAIMQGSALHTMSCSDKVARWNILGFQGALLSVLMDPIYYSSIILGSLHHPVHFRRAMISRLEPLEPSIQPPYILNKPRLLMVSREGKRRVKKSPAHAIAWVADWSAYEAIASTKGRCEPGGVASRLTKRMAFMRFLKLYKNKTGTRDNYADLSYEAAKLLAEDFQTNKTTLLTHLTEAGLGNWISKPIEQDAFFLK